MIREANRSAESKDPFHFPDHPPHLDFLATPELELLAIVLFVPAIGDPSTA
jgi:hypothetical protein